MRRGIAAATLLLVLAGCEATTTNAPVSTVNIVAINADLRKTYILAPDAGLLHANPLEDLVLPPFKR